MAVGMKFHKFAEPKPPHPNFKIVVPSRLSSVGGSFRLVFYLPESYKEAPEDYRFPVVVNFHGGGFTLGTGTDDARWASAILTNVNAVFVSVEYRLAPEYPFSVGVEDGTDAVIYLAAHAEELKLDPHRMALSGFSAGANFVFTVPLMLHDLQNHAGRRSLADSAGIQNSSTHHGKPLSRTPSVSASNSKSGSTLSLPRPTISKSHSTGSVFKLTDLEPTALEIEQKVPNITLGALISFYPPTDFRIPREEKKKSNPKPEFNLPPLLTNLFDESYLHGPDLDLSDPYLSPAAAPAPQLKAAYPDDIILYTCEYDMLNKEGVEFGERLLGKGIEKSVHGGLIKAVPHGFDKKPNPLQFPKEADKCYSEACAELKRVFGAGRVSVEERAQLNEVLGVDRFADEELLGEGDRLMSATRRSIAGPSSSGKGKGIDGVARSTD